MKIRIVSLFSEPHCFFEISYEVHNLIEKKLNEVIVIPEGINKLKKTDILNLIVSTNSRTSEVEVKGPDYSRKYSIFNWGIWLPYKEIIGSANQLTTYLKYFFDATVILLHKYCVEECIVREIQKEVERIVIDNEEYFFYEYSTPQIDVCDLIFE